MPSQPFVIVYALATREHLRVIDRRFHTMIREAIETQLTFEPTDETVNRKPLKRPVTFGATWELRCGSKNEFRVFYDVDLNVYEVNILAVGRKERNKLFIGGRELEL